MPIVSIIIPCFNAAATIQHALGSLVAQTFSDYEVLLVDDASEDGTPNIIQNFCEKNPGLKFNLKIHAERQGVSVGRNDALSMATGEYVTFLDADDALHPDFLRTMVALAQQRSADLVACNAVRVTDGIAHGVGIYPELEIESCEGKDIVYRPALQKYFSTCWCKLYRRELLRKNEITFTPGMSFAEDTLFAIRSAMQAGRLAIAGKFCGYFYTVGGVSSTSVMQAEKRLHGLRILLTELNRELSSENRGLLLRKSQEYLWTIKKFGGAEKRRLLNEALQDKLWSEILYPVICGYGKLKYRLLITALGGGYLWPLKFW